MTTMMNKVDKLVLYFILVLGIIAVSLWTIFLIQLTQINEQTHISQTLHTSSSIEAAKNLVDTKLNVIEAKQSAIEAKEVAHETFDMVKNMMNNISEINSKIK